MTMKLQRADMATRMLSRNAGSIWFVPIIVHCTRRFGSTQTFQRRRQTLTQHWAKSPFFCKGTPAPQPVPHPRLSSLSSRLHLHFSRSFVEQLVFIHTPAPSLRCWVETTYDFLCFFAIDDSCLSTHRIIHLSRFHPIVHSHAWNPHVFSRATRHRDRCRSFA